VALALALALALASTPGPLVACNDCVQCNELTNTTYLGILKHRNYVSLSIYSYYSLFIVYYGLNKIFLAFGAQYKLTL